MAKACPLMVKVTSGMFRMFWQFTLVCEKTITHTAEYSGAAEVVFIAVLKVSS